MEVGLFQVKVNPMMLFLVILILSIGSCVHASSNAQTDSTEKYIAKNYFEKYESLREHEFDNYIANEIPLGLSQVIIDKHHVVPSLSNLQRDVIGEGSHRRISSSIRFKLQAKLISELDTANSCELIIIEKLPSGVFADPFELQHLVQRGVLSDAAVFGDTNLELPSFRANRSVVEVHMSIASKVLSRNENDVEVNLEVPLHARYPPLGVDFSRVEFGRPDLFISCSLGKNAVDKRCLLMQTDHISEEKANPVIWDIPCGKKKHAEVVSFVTFGSAILSAFLIVLASISYSDTKGSSNKLKNS